MAQLSLIIHLAFKAEILQLPIPTLLPINIFDLFVKLQGGGDYYIFSETSEIGFFISPETCKEEIYSSNYSISFYKI